MTLNILLTGGTGFLGGALAKTLLNQGVYNIKQISRRELKDHLCVLSLNGDTDFNLPNGYEVVVHCAARVHVMVDKSSNPLEEFREINTYGTLNLAQQAASAGVKRFIFISSIKVNGESTEFDCPFKSDDTFIPTDPYGLSKYEAEVGLREIANKTGMEVVVIRPTLVYGPGVKANFTSLLNLVFKGFPMPFGCINDNKRSLVSVNNLIDLIVTCIDHPKAANQTFLVSDDNDISTASIVKHMSKALEQSSLLLPVPLWCYYLVGKLTGKRDVVERLLGSLQVDISHTKDTLGWVPPQTLVEGFKETAEAFLLNKSK